MSKKPIEKIEKSKAKLKEAIELAVLDFQESTGIANIEIVIEIDKYDSDIDKRKKVSGVNVIIEAKI